MPAIRLIDTRCDSLKGHYVNRAEHQPQAEHVGHQDPLRRRLTLFIPHSTQIGAAESPGAAAGQRRPLVNHRRLQQPGQPGGLPKRAGYGASIATMRLATSAIAKVHELAGHESPGRDQGVRASLKGRGAAAGQAPAPGRRPHHRRSRRDLPTAIQPRLRGRGFETPEQAAQREKFDVALVAVLSDAELCRSEASPLTWGDVQRWDDGSGRITVARSKTDTEAQGAVVAIIPAAMRALDAIRPARPAMRKCSGCRSRRSPGG